MTCHTRRRATTRCDPRMTPLRHLPEICRPVPTAETISREQVALARRVTQPRQIALRGHLSGRHQSARKIWGVIPNLEEAAHRDLAIAPASPGDCHECGRPSSTRLSTGRRLAAARPTPFLRQRSRPAQALTSSGAILLGDRRLARNIHDERHRLCDKSAGLLAATRSPPRPSACTLPGRIGVPLRRNH